MTFRQGSPSMGQGNMKDSESKKVMIPFHGNPFMAGRSLRFLQWLRRHNPLVRDRRRILRHANSQKPRQARQDGHVRRTYQREGRRSYPITYLIMKTLELPLNYWAIPYYSFPNWSRDTSNYETFAEYEVRWLKTKAALTVSIGNYAQGWYEWWWSLFAKDILGNWYKWDCWHCSCYWPLERWESGIFTQDEIEKLMEEYPDILEYAKENLFDK